MTRKQCIFVITNRDIWRCISSRPVLRHHCPLSMCAIHVTTVLGCVYADTLHIYLGNSINTSFRCVCQLCFFYHLCYVNDIQSSRKPLDRWSLASEITVGPIKIFVCWSYGPVKISASVMSLRLRAIKKLEGPVNFYFYQSPWPVNLNRFRDDWTYQLFSSSVQATYFTIWAWQPLSNIWHPNFGGKCWPIYDG